MACHNVKLANSLEAVAEHGPLAFYGGEVGQKLVDDMRKAEQVLNILESYRIPYAAEGALGLHRMIEALKDMFAIRMNLGDPAFVDIDEYIADITSYTSAQELRKKIFDNTTFPPDYYINSHLRDNGTSHFCILDSERNTVSNTTTVNYIFGAGIVSPSTGIVINNEMDDFSTPTEISPEKLPPAPANFNRPGK
ncbi:hypothetical protein Droror1_Dr00018010 [Drosera rotundifolia]